MNDTPSLITIFQTLRNECPDDGAYLWLVLPWLAILYFVFFLVCVCLWLW